MLSRFLLMLLLAVPQAAAADTLADHLSPEDLARLIGTWDPAHCAESKLRLSPDFVADRIECLGGGVIRSSPSVRASGEGFSLVLDAHLGGGGAYSYQTPKQYFQDSPEFLTMSGWGPSEDGPQRFDYSVFRADLKGDNTGTLSCVALTRHSAPYMGRGWLSQHLILGVYCDETSGDGPVPEARITQVIDAIEFDFE